MNIESLETAGLLVGRSAGLRLEVSQKARLQQWLGETATRRHVSLHTLVEELITGGPALQEALDVVTVQETSFFRDSAQFDALSSYVLPNAPSPILVWSAGCSYGQEAYSLAMQLEMQGIFDWRVVATDISTGALSKAAQARYTDRELRGLSDDMCRRFLRRVGTEWAIVPELRERVTVQRQNLTRDPPPGNCFVVFCRNVLIYFDRPSLNSALNTIAISLLPTGTLFLGYSESLWQISTRFEMVRLGEAFAYRLPSATQTIKPHVKSPHTTVQPQIARSIASAVLPQNPTPNHNKASDTAAMILADGELALQAGDVLAAIGYFRQACYSEPKDPIAHFHLGLALERGLQPKEALRAFRAARSMLKSSENTLAVTALEGFEVSELARALDARIGGLTS